MDLLNQKKNISVSRVSGVNDFDDMQNEASNRTLDKTKPGWYLQEKSKPGWYIEEDAKTPGWYINEEIS